MKIYHVYGKLAELPWESETQPLEYGREIWLSQLDERKNNIKTIYERKENKTSFEPIVESFNYADKVSYLGFGFAKEIVEILSFDKSKNPYQRIYVSDFDKRHVRTETQMRGLGIWREDKTIIVDGGDCRKVIEDYLY